MSAALYRGHCPACGWHGRALVSESAAFRAAARHVLTRHASDHSMSAHTQTLPADAYRAPWSWK